MPNSFPLVVDLDGTLIATDMLYESYIRLLKASPLSAALIPLKLLQGKARLKAWLAARYDFDPEILPYNDAFAAWLREEHAAGRRLVLATASDRSIACTVADQLGIFDEVIASENATNLKGATKANALVARFGNG